MPFRTLCFLTASLLGLCGCSGLMDKINNAPMVQQIEQAPQGEKLQLIPGLLEFVRQYKASPAEIEAATALYQSQGPTDVEREMIATLTTSSTATSSSIVAIPIGHDKKTGVSKLMLFDVRPGKLVNNQVYEMKMNQAAMQKLADKQTVSYHRLLDFQVGFTASSFGLTADAN